MPDDGVDKLVKASQCGPDHIKACSSIPSLKVPWQRHENENETKESENRKDRVGWVSHFELNAKRIKREEPEERRGRSSGGRKHSGEEE